jgi:hypothetical protein
MEIPTGVDGFAVIVLQMSSMKRWVGQIPQNDSIN